MSRDIHFLNHTSLILEYDDYFLLLDPWPSESLAFESWKPHPPCFLNENLLSAFMNVSKEKSGVVVSHGHDDHCDDSFLSKLSSSTEVFFPNFKSKGARRRLFGNGLDNIKEINELEFVGFGPFNLTTFVIKEESEDDAVFIIQTDDYIFVHANDNSVKFPSKLIEFIIREAEGRKIYFASQTGIANGFPYCYPQFLEDENKEKVTEIVIGKTKKTIQLAIDNALAVGAENFITYAAYTISLPLLDKYKGTMNQFFPSPANLVNLGLNWGNVNLLDFVPGDSLRVLDDDIRRPFWLKMYGIEKISEELKNYRLQSLAPFKDRFKEEFIRLPEFTFEQLIGFLMGYLDGFFRHISKLENLWKDEIVNKTLMISVLSVGNLCINLSDGQYVREPLGKEPNKKIIIDKDTFLLLMAGVFNFESIYIGHHAMFERYPREKYNHELMMQLMVYGYIYQKRMVPTELTHVKMS